MAVDDNGNPFELSPDPMLETVRPYISSIRLGEEFNAEELLKPILSDVKIFGVNLYDVGMVSLVCSYFKEMTAGTGAVRATIKKYV
jgi:fructuronate reductase